MTFTANAESPVFQVVLSLSMLLCFAAQRSFFRVLEEWGVARDFVIFLPNFLKEGLSIVLQERKGTLLSPFVVS